MKQEIAALRSLLQAKDMLITELQRRPVYQYNPYNYQPYYGYPYIWTSGYAQSQQGHQELSGLAQQGSSGIVVQGSAGSGILTTSSTSVGSSSNQLASTWTSR